MDQSQITNNADKPTVNFDFNRSRGEFLRAIQHQLDVVTFLITGAQKVVAEELEPQGFHHFSPAYGAKLPYEVAKEKAFLWLNTSFLRDSIEATDQFLGRCLSFCAAISYVRDGVIKADVLDHLVNVLPHKHNKLHFPAKIAELERKYGVRPHLAAHVLSLNRVRTCLVHRLGRVTKLDADEQGHLVAKWLTSQFVLRGLETGTQIVLTEPGQGLDEKSMLEMHIVEYEKGFTLGEEIALSPYDVFSTIFTLWRFGLYCADAIEGLASSAGVRVVRREAEG
jgi:hypothetical protein